jgi:DNA-directed RNA polymerase specialized sigma24 family protein
VLLASRELLAQDELDDFMQAEALIPRVRSNQPVVAMTGMALDELSWVLPDQVSAERPQRALCHQVRKLVRRLTARQREALRLLFVEELSHPEVLERMGLSGYQLDEAVEHGLARLRAWLNLSDMIS